MAPYSERARRVVLLVEHELEMLQSAGNALREADYEVHTAQSASEARHCMQSVTPDLMLINARLPEMDGFLLERRFQSGRQMPPVVLLGSGDSSYDVRRGYECGAFCHIFQGASVDRLAEMLDSAFERLEFEGGTD